MLVQRQLVPAAVLLHLGLAPHTCSTACDTTLSPYRAKGPVVVSTTWLCLSTLPTAAGSLQTQGGLVVGLTPQLHA
jgi:hypothetical protein